ncbi:MAG: RIP metalloprotease RseP [Opitutae bacterium]|nr:RIP metalloprotease RseP [Opitutae bacterium]
MSWLYDFWFILVALFFLGLSIFVHELGHFLAAKRRGLVIKRFSIGFGPRIFGWEKNGVEYRLSAFPFGGYVALPQLVDMGRIEGGEEEEEEVKELETLPKISYSDKMIVSVMGAVFNVLLALSLACVLWFFGHEVYSSQLTTEVGYVAKKLDLTVTKTNENISVDGPAYQAGIKTGDKILEVDGDEVRDFLDIQQRITAGTSRSEDGKRVVRLLIAREGQAEPIEIEVFPGLVSNEQMRMIGIGPKESLSIANLIEGVPAEKSGLEVGDWLWAVNGERVLSFGDLKHNHLKKAGYAQVEVTVRKGSEEGPLMTYKVHTIERKTYWKENGKWRNTHDFLIGFQPQLKQETIYPNPLQTIWNRTIDMYVTLRALINPESDVKLRNMSGPVGIVHHLSIFAKIGWMKLFWFVVFINVNLAILNVLPIPVLDGGHMMFASIEKLRGKPIPLAILERTQVLFVVLIFSFMLYVTFFDVRRIFPS